jgi:hypothetical protein
VSGKNLKLETWNMELPFGKLRAVSLSNGSRRLALAPVFYLGRRMQNVEWMSGYHFLDTRHQKLDTVFMTSNFKHQTSNSSSDGRTVRLKKPHPCGGNEFTVIRESVIVTLRCNTCESFVRMPREKYVKAVIGDR